MKAGSISFKNVSFHLLLKDDFSGDNPLTGDQGAFTLFPGRSPPSTIVEQLNNSYALGTVESRSFIIKITGRGLQKEQGLVGIGYIGYPDERVL